MMAASAVAEEAPVLTQHHARIAGKDLAYTAEAGRIAIRDAETGEPHGYMFYTAYRVAGKQHTARPLAFIWNGGPGADSSLLHFSAVGPRRIESGALVDNNESWLAFADLVLVDPIGTGFSRPTKAEYGAEFYGTLGDIASVTEFIRAWRIQHRAEDAPLWLAGESWGAGRAASVGYQLQHRGINVAGLVLISGGWGLNDPPLPKELNQALTIVDMATVAVFHKRAQMQPGETLESFRKRVATWAREVYAPALSRVDALNETERNDLAAQLSTWSGLPLETIDRKKLAISPRQFRTTLLRDRQREAYLFDLRRTRAPDESPPAVLLNYWRGDLRYPTDLPYLGLERVETGYIPADHPVESINERWNYATAQLSKAEIDAAIAAAVASGSGPPRLGPPPPASAEAVALNPRMRILVAGGLYDSFLPCAVGEETERHLSGALHAAMTFRCYIGGHAMYLDAPARRALSNDVGALIR
jgi:carboxypeptidase C (cathepsin A)